MNNLSWFLYLAEMSDRLGAFSVMIAISSGIAMVFYLIGRIISVDDELTAEVVKKFWFLPWVFATFVAVAILVPSKDTIYMIAGSEAGEAVVTSPEGKEILNDIKEVIRHQLGELKAEK